MSRALRIGGVLWLALLPFLLSGCAVSDIERPTVEDLGMIGVMGIDYAGDRQMEVTVTVPQATGSVSQKTQTYSIISDLPHDAIMELSTESERSLSLGQLRVILFGEEFAKKRGLEMVINHLYRDPMIGDNVYLGVVRGSARELLTSEYPDKPSVNQFLNDMLRPRGATAFHSFVTIHKYIYDTTDEVSDPLLPYLSKLDRTIKVTHVALFRQGKMIDRISPDEAKIFGALEGQTQLPNFKLQVGSDQIIMLTLVKGELELTGNGSLEKPLVDVDLKIKGSIIGYSGDKDLEERDQLGQLERAMAVQLKKQAEHLIKRFRQNRIDPVHFGEAVRAKYKGKWSKQVWDNLLPRTQFRVQVKVEVVQTWTMK